MDSAELQIAMEQHQHRNSKNYGGTTTEKIVDPGRMTDQQVSKKGGQSSLEVPSANKSEQNNGIKCESLTEEAATISDKNLNNTITHTLNSDITEEVPAKGDNNEEVEQGCVKGHEDVEEQEEEDSEVQGDESFSSNQQFYKRTRNKSSDSTSPILDERYKPKDSDFSTDFKLKVLHWAYCKSIHSAGHHFRLQRYIVRTWMLNEEKIYKSATEKGRLIKYWILLKSPD